MSAVRSPLLFAEQFGNTLHAKRHAAVQLRVYFPNHVLVGPAYVVAQHSNVKLLGSMRSRCRTHWGAAPKQLALRTCSELLWNKYAAHQPFAPPCTCRRAPAWRWLAADPDLQVSASVVDDHYGLIGRRCSRKRYCTYHSRCCLRAKPSNGTRNSEAAGALLLVAQRVAPSHRWMLLACFCCAHRAGSKHTMRVDETKARMHS
eukprot:362866-Chlamydomonas_euryale.AAC.35